MISRMRRLTPLFTLSVLFGSSLSQVASAQSMYDKVVPIPTHGSLSIYQNHTSAGKATIVNVCLTQPTAASTVTFSIISPSGTSTTRQVNGTTCVHFQFKPAAPLPGTMMTNSQGMQNPQGEQSSQGSQAPQ